MFLLLSFFTILVLIPVSNICETKHGVLYKLGKENVLSYPLTVSGFSSGASMAIQTHISSSSRFHGVGAFAGVFYRCVGPSMNKTLCWNGETSVNSSITDAMSYEANGLIDPLQNLNHQKLFFWHGLLDEVLPQLHSGLGIVSFYQRFIHSPQNIQTKLQSAYHLLPTNSVNQLCTEVTKAPYRYLGNCNYSGSYEALKFLIGPDIKAPTENISLQPLRLFDQTEFFGGLTSEEIGMDSSGFYYVPKNCKERTASCLIHVFLHGCTLQKEIMGSTFVQYSGFLEVGEANNIIMLFPQTISLPDVNLNGCWDYEGFTGMNYATRKAPQISAVNAMIDRLMKG